MSTSVSTRRPASPRADGEHFRLLVESVKDYAIFMLDADGYVQTWNAGAEAIKGYSAGEIIGEHFSRFYEPEAIARAWPDHELALAKANGRFEDEGWRLRKDGTRFWASVVITALHDHTGLLLGFAKVTRDLTTRRRLEESQQAERRTNEFLAMLAHELRNPLAPMRTGLDLAVRAPDDPAVQQMVLGLFERQLGHLTRIVDDLLDVSRITAGKIELAFEPGDLAEIARERVAAFEPIFAAAGQALALSVPATPVPVLVDPTRIAQVVSNLLANANKFTPAGGHVLVDVRVEQGHALLEVRDDGNGIEPHMLGAIFEPFVQAHATGYDRRSGGLGIGLTLVRQLVERHGGTVAATSAGPGAGSTFSVRLPLHDASPPRPRVVAPNDPGPSLRILVVDDNPDIVRTMALLVRALGHEAEVAEDGVNALIKAAEFRPDIVLLDIGLPHMNGYDVARALRTLPALRQTMLVACTGYGRSDDTARGRDAGFDAHLVKPVAAEQLLAIVRAARTRKVAGR